VNVTGADQCVACSYLRSRFGEVLSSLRGLNEFSTHTGYVVDVGRVGYGLYVDMGIEEPSSLDALIPLHSLRSHLADGNKVSVNKISSTYGIVDNFPLSIRMTEFDLIERKIGAEITDHQIAMFERWTSDGLNRVLAFGISTTSVKEAIKACHLDRDIVEIEAFGLFEQSIVCKLGTDAAGVIKLLGGRLRGIPLQTFRPKETKKLSGAKKITRNYY
jgi:hypothetical protein